MRVICLLVISIVSGSVVFSQEDFDKYQTLVSVGEIPKDFSSHTYNKISDDRDAGRDNLTGHQEKVFFQGIHYGIDDILNSGMVVYGDEVSSYVKQIAKNLLKDDKELFAKLRFYTLKSNETNAFSTDQGIIFVTTGLISRVGSEARLAYVLAHEISHYIEHHVVDGFKFRTELKQRDRNIRSLSIYSKANEMEADRVGLEIFNKAGYGLDELYGTFNVLSHAHLHFGNLEFPKDYFTTSQMKVPESLFPVEDYIIVLNDSANDVLSSHPNIITRKKQIESLVGNYTEWGSEINFFGAEKFEYIQTICRFESVRVEVLNANYIDAMYTVFVLEKNHPNSTYLKQMKARIWLGIVQAVRTGKLHSIVKTGDDLQGEIAMLHRFIIRLESEAILTLGLRQLYDLRAMANEDQQIELIYQCLIGELQAEKSFDLERFYDSEKIRTEEFNVDEFQLFGISDIIADSIGFVEKMKDKSLDPTGMNLDMSSNVIWNASELDNKFSASSIDNLIVLDPTVHSYYRDQIKLIKSEKLREKFSDVIEFAAEKNTVHVHLIDRDNVIRNGTEIFNERNILLSYLNQLTLADGTNTIPIDFELLKRIRLKYGTSKIMLVQAEHSYRHVLLQSLAILPLYPIASIAVPIMILHRNQTNLSLAVLDMEKNELDFVLSYGFSDGPRKYNLGAHMFSIFKAISTK
jgi:hypothetical protein